VLDEQGRFLLFNDACERATGFAREDVVGRDARESVIPPEQAESFGEVIAAIWRTGTPSPQVGHWLRRDGGRLLIAWSNRAVLDTSGRPRYVVCSGLDLTERERAAAEVRALQGDLAAKLGEVAQLAQEQTALRRVATLVAAEASQEEIFAAVSRQCARVLDAHSAGVFRYEADGRARLVGMYDRDGKVPYHHGEVIRLDMGSAIGIVQLTGRPARVDDYADVDSPLARRMRDSGLRTTVGAPIVVGGTTWGAVGVSSPDANRFPPRSEARLADFCELVSLAVASAAAREEVRASRARLVQAADTERRRLERNLHDGAQQRLVALQLSLRLVRARLAEDPDGAVELLETAGAELDSALAELRELAHGLHPMILTQRGLRPALEQLAARSPVPVVLHGTPPERLPESVEAAAYYVVAESLTNVAKHSAASAAEVTVRCERGAARVEVRDDGRGGADAGGGTGLRGLRDRVDALGGSLAVDSPAGEGTIVRAVLPLR
jgi:PAS domain S-box-containing protein